MQRRKFIHHFGLGAVALTTGIPGIMSSPDFSLTILHTNDLHGRFGLMGNNDNIFALRAGQLIEKARNTASNVLLLDAGDVLHPSLSQGEELQWMSSLGYDALVLGNHDFDRGMEDLARQIRQNKVIALAANYGFDTTPLQGLVKPYRIFEKGGQRIGVMGIGVNPTGLVPPVLREGMTHLDPIETANQTAIHLKQVEACCMVICLSHLGYHYKDQQVSDLQLAASSRDIDVVIGGHTHTFLPEPVVVNNLNGQPVLINHAGWGGLLMGRIELQYSNGSIRSVKGENITVGAQELKQTV